MHDVEDMHWYLWEAISLQAHDMYQKRLVSQGLEIEVNSITKETQASGRFSEDLRTRACRVADALVPNTKEWRRLVAIEYEEMP